MAGPVRRAGMKVGDHWPSPKDGLSDPQNTAGGQYTNNEAAGTFEKTNASPVLAPGKGTQPSPEAEKANDQSISRRNKGLPESEKG